MLNRRLVPTLFGLGIVLGLGLLRAADPYPVQALRDIAFDFYQRSRPRAAADFPIRIIDIDEASLREVGQWPWPRDRLALMVDRLGEMGAAAIAFDVLLPEPDRLSPRRLARDFPGLADAAALPDTDEMLVRALGRAPVVLGFADSPYSRTLPEAPKSGFAVSGGNPIQAVPPLQGAVVPLPSLGAAASGLGSLSLASADSVATVRRLPLLWTDGKQYFPTLSLETLRLALGVTTIVVMAETGGGFVEAVRIGDITIPTTPAGELWLHYRRPDAGQYVAARDLLGPDYRRHAAGVAGHIVLIGTSASGLLDIHGTPLGDNVPGVSIHAQALEQMLSASFLTRTDWVSGLEIVGFLALGVLLVFAILGLGPLAGLVIGAAALSGAGLYSWLMFTTAGVLVDPSFPLLGLAVVYAALVFFRFLRTDRDKRQLRRAFGHYVAPALLAQIERDGAQLQLGGETRQLSVMFTDVRGFTTLSERLAPQRLLGILNTLFGALGARITEEMGTIDKFVGDAVMAFWNAPVDVADHARRACRAALGMRATLRRLNAEDAFGLRGAAAGVEEIGIGVGIATGEALVGNMGLETRFDYSALGDTVNTAARLEGACKDVAYDIVLAAATATAAPDFACLEAGSILLKGKSGRAPIHILVGDAELAKSAAFRALEAEHRQLVAALRDGRDAGALVARCGLKAAAIDPLLVQFYGRVPERRADFARDQALAVAE